MGVVEIDTDGPVTIVAINRPSARKAVDGQTATALAEAFEAFEGDEAAFVAVLTGRGDTFCAGADLKAMGTDRQNQVRRTGRGPMGPTRMALSKPVIAAIEGHAVAGGLELAVWCDLRVLAEDAILGVYCRRWGVPLIDGGTVRLPRIVGHSRAMDLILTGREVGAAEALAIGLGNRVVPSGEALTESVRLAHELATLPQQCLRSDRASALRQWGLSEDEAMLAEFDLGVEVLRSGQGLEGAARFASGAGRHGTPAT